MPDAVPANIAHNLSPSRSVASNDVDAPLALDDALVLLQEAEEARESADTEFSRVLIALGLRGDRTSNPAEN